VIGLVVMLLTAVIVLVVVGYLLEAGHIDASEFF